MKNQSDPVIVSTCRTPIGKLRGGLSLVRPDDLLAHVFQHAVTRAGIPAEQIGEVFAGCANQAGEDNRNVARMATLLAGFPYEIPGVTVNRLCASGLEAVVQAARTIKLGDRQTVLAGGTESMSRAPWVMQKPEKPLPSGVPAMYDTALGWRFPNPKMQERFPLESMGETAENVAAKHNISRQDQDEFALLSHQKALRAQKQGWFDKEIVPIEKTTRDEGPRQDSTLEQLSKLKPAFKPDGSVTAGNSSTLNDGAAALMITSREYASTHGLPVLARIAGWASAGVEPSLMGIGPVPATIQVLEKTKLTIADLDAIELNEAFAAQSLAVIRALKLPAEKVNVFGGAIALGHPLGCSGARILVTLLSVLKHQDREWGLATLCVGVGQGLSVIVARE